MEDSDNKKRKAPLDLHLRVWDRTIARFIHKQAERHRRSLTTEVVVALERGVAEIMKENANGK